MVHRTRQHFRDSQDLNLTNVDGPKLPVVEHRAINQTSMTLEEFKSWLDSIDSDRDGRISRKELKDVLHRLGLRWAGVKAWMAVHNADLNRNHFIDGDDEMLKLGEYARKHWGISVTLDKK